ncbi:hypothetical protein [Vibrio phage RYC]|nr:hypothetical protein [Vibrio phage RYC]
MAIVLHKDIADFVQSLQLRNCQLDVYQSNALISISERLTEYDNMMESSLPMKPKYEENPVFRKPTWQQILDMERAVLEWNELMGNKLDDETLIPTYYNLCEEEVKEGVEASSKEEELDAICDQIFTGFMLNRLSNLLGLTGFKEYYESFDVSQLRTDADIYYMWKSLLDDIKNGEDVGKLTMQTLAIIIYLSVDYDIVGAFERVCRSNFSKAIPLAHATGKYDSFIKEVKKEGRYGDVFAVEQGNHLLIKAGIDTKEGKNYVKGKIVKGSWYQSVEELGGLSEYIYTT